MLRNQFKSDNISEALKRHEKLVVTLKTCPQESVLLIYLDGHYINCQIIWSDGKSEEFGDTPNTVWEVIENFTDRCLEVEELNALYETGKLVI